MCLLYCFFFSFSRSSFYILFFFFFFNDTATTEIYTLSLHDALPISLLALQHPQLRSHRWFTAAVLFGLLRSEEHTSELQSQSNLVCRLLLEKKKKKNKKTTQYKERFCKRTILAEMTVSTMVYCCTTY